LTPPLLHLVAPGPLDQRTGGYIYDARMASELLRLGWQVELHPLAGLFPAGDAVARKSLASALEGIPDGQRVLLDGLAMGGLPEVLAPHQARLRPMAMVHHPLADETGLSAEEKRRFGLLEAQGLAACIGVVVSSPFTAERLVDGFGVPRERIRVVLPGTDPTPGADGPRGGMPPALLSVGSVVPRKGHDLLVEALARIRHLPWSCVCAGSLTRDPEHAAKVLERLASTGLEERVRFPGEVEASELEGLYRGSSLFVLPSHYEGYGMALAEALAWGIPVVSTRAGAISGTVPREAGVLVPPGDPGALAAVLEELLSEAGGKPDGSGRLEGLRRGAQLHARTLPRWELQGEAMARALLELAPDPPPTNAFFAGGWLALREPVDHRSRPPELLVPLAAEWTEQGWSRVLDLGSGTGSNLRYLAPRLPGPQEWTLLDHDPELLAAVEAPSGIPALSLARTRGALGREGLSLVPGAHLVTGSALLDLVSLSWLEALVGVCGGAGVGVLLALSYDGTIRWGPGDGGDPDPLDPQVEEAVNSHQRRDKGTGPALGPDAAAAAYRLFRQAGFRTWFVPSPWRLGPGDRELATTLLEGWVEAAVEERPTALEAFREWRGRRLDTLAGEAFSLHVGHLDLLALPPRRHGSRR